jgi:hypothetical protein
VAARLFILIPDGAKSPRRSIPILLFAVLDRPVHYFTTLMRYPQVSSHV